MSLTALRYESRLGVIDINLHEILVIGSAPTAIARTMPNHARAKRPASHHHGGDNAGHDEQNHRAVHSTWLYARYRPPVPRSAYRNRVKRNCAPWVRPELRPLEFRRKINLAKFDAAHTKRCVVVF